MNITWFKLKQKQKKIKILYVPVKAYKNWNYKRDNERKRQLLQENGLEITSKISKVLDNSGIEYFFTYGTLLGLIRNGGFMKHDIDLDLGVIRTEEFSWNKLNSLLTNAGFKQLHEFSLDGEITEQTYEYKGMTIDFFIYEKENEHMISYVYFNKKGIVNEDPTKKFVSKMISSQIKEFKYLEINNQKYRIPVNAEQYLADIYSESWRIPNPNWVSEEGPAWNELEGKYGIYKEIK